MHVSPIALPDRPTAPADRAPRHRWLRYHRSLGIYKVFVHVEDTPELLPLLRSDEFADFVVVSTGNDNSLDTHNPNSHDNYYTLMQRQERQVKSSVQKCREQGIEWLFHVDDDELLHFEASAAPLPPRCRPAAAPLPPRCRTF